MADKAKDIRTVYRAEVGGCYAEIEPFADGERFTFELRGDSHEMDCFIETHIDGQCTIHLDSLEIATLAKLVLSVPCLRRKLQEAGLLNSGCKEVSDG